MTGPRRVTPTAMLALPADAPRERWLARRRELIGSSDIADICGVGYNSARHVYYQKIGALPLEQDIGEPALWGNLHEETVAREWARRNKSVVTRVGLVVHHEQTWMGATLDRRIPGGACPLMPNAKGAVCCLEVKTRNAYVASRWRTGVPDDVHAQALWQRMVTGYDHVHVACLIGGNDYRQYVVRSDLDLEARVGIAANLFWRDVQTRRVPAIQDEVDPERYVELDQRLHPNRAGTRRLTDAATLEVQELLREYRASGAIVAAHSKSRDRNKARLLELADGADTVVADEQVLFTYDEVNLARKVDFDRLAEQYPDAYRECVTQPKGRTLRVKWKGE